MKRPGTPGTSYIPVMFLKPRLPTRCSFTCGSGPVASAVTALDDCHTGVADGRGDEAGGAGVDSTRGSLSPPPPQALSSVNKSAPRKIRSAINIHDEGCVRAASINAA